MSEGGRNPMTNSLICLLLLCCSCSANIRTCFVDLLFYHGVGPSPTTYDIADQVNSGNLLSCKKAELLCWVNMQSHVEAHLGTGVAPIRDTAAQALCNIIRREILSTTPTQVYADWTVSNCDVRGRLYLGQICCWKYSIGSQSFFINNPSCSQCTKPNCTEEVNPTKIPTIYTRDPNPLQTLPSSDFRKDSKADEKGKEISRGKNSLMLSSFLRKPIKFQSSDMNENNRDVNDMETKADKHDMPLEKKN